MDSRSLPRIAVQYLGFRVDPKERHRATKEVSHDQVLSKDQQLLKHKDPNLLYGTSQDHFLYMAAWYLDIPWILARTLI